MKISKKLIIIIAISIFIVSIGLTYGFNILANHKAENNIATLNKIKELEKNSKDKKTTTKQSNELAVYDSLIIEEKLVDELESAFQITNNKIPILMYHSISYEKGNTVRVSKENFRKQMKYLKDNNYTTLTLDELYIYMKTGKIIPNKPVVITFDDGYLDNYTNAYPILKEFNLKATLFVITNTIDHEKNYLTSKQIKSMDASNIRIESHTASHEHLDKVSYSDNVKTMTASKIKLEEILGRKINYIAYPYGGYNDVTIKATKKSGYKLAFSTDFGWIDKNDNIYSLGRIFVSSALSFEQFKAKLIYNK